MDLTNTAVRWINLDAGSAKSSESVSTKSTGKTPNLAFSASLRAIHHGQRHADSGNSVPHEEQSTDSIEVRILTTHTAPTTTRSGKGLSSEIASRTSTPTFGSNTNQSDLLSEISAFNKDSQIHDASLAVSDDSLTPLRGSINPTLAQNKLSVEGSETADRPVTTVTASLAAELKGTSPELKVTSQHALSADARDTSDPSVDLNSIQSDLPAQQASAAGALSDSPELETASQVLRSTEARSKGSVPVELGQNGAHNIAASLSAPESKNAQGFANPLNAEIQLIATQTSDKRALEGGKLVKSAIALSAGQEFKLPNSASKQAPLKFVMIEASATLQQWQKLKQLDTDNTDSSTEPVSTLQPSETRSLRASPELQAARLVKTEQDAQALTQKFAEQLGQRLIQTVQKGHWRAELELHPKSLGRIDVQLDFVNGQLEGHFQTHNPQTRELLQEGLPRLREWLQQTGTQVANLEVSNGNSGQGGEKPTPQMLAGRQHDTANDEPVADLASQDGNPQTLKEGFDLLV